MEKNEIQNIDCIEGMKLLEKETIDIVVTSPPYNIGLNYKSYKDNLEKTEYLEWFNEVIDQVKRILKENGSFFLNIGGKPSDQFWPLEIAYLVKEYFYLQNTIHWIKSVSIEKNQIGNYPHILRDFSAGHFKPVNSPSYLNNCHEYIFHFTKNGETSLDKLSIGVPYQDKTNQKRWKNNLNIRDRGNVWFIPYETIKTSRPHPSTFPIKLPEMCIKLHGLKKNGLVLDPFMGIGSTALACLKLGFHYLGFEVDKDYVEIARERIKNFKKENIKSERREKEMTKIVIENLPPEKMAPLLKNVEGQGGFQSLLRKLQKQYSEEKQQIILEENDIKKIVMYSNKSKYGQGGFQDRLEAIFDELRKINSELNKLEHNDFPS